MHDGSTGMSTREAHEQHGHLPAVQRFLLEARPGSRCFASADMEHRLAAIQARNAELARILRSMASEA